MRWIWVLLVIASCGKSKATCKADAYDLAAFLRKADHGARALYVPDDVHLVERMELPPVEVNFAPSLIVRATGIEYQGQVVTNGELEQRLEAMAMKMEDDKTRGRLPSDVVLDHRLYVAVARDASWERVVDVSTNASAVGFKKLVFVFSKPSTEIPPPPSSVSAELDRIKASDALDRASGLAKLMQSIVKSCPPVVKVFGAVASSDGGSKASHLIDGMEKALVECNCDVDMPALREVFYSVVADTHPLTELVVILDRTATPIVLPPTTRWQDAADKLLGISAGAKIWLQ